MFERATSPAGRLLTLVLVLAGGAWASLASAGEELEHPASDADVRLGAFLADVPSAGWTAAGTGVDGQLPMLAAWPARIGDRGASWAYRPSTGAATDTPVMQVCIVPSDVPATDGSCAHADSDPIAVSEHEGRTLYVIPVGPSADRREDRQDLEASDHAGR